MKLQSLLSPRTGLAFGLLLTTYLMLAAAEPSQSDPDKGQALPETNAPNGRATPKKEAAQKAAHAPEAIVKEVAMQEKSFSMIAGRSHLLRFSKKINRISVSDPEVLDFVILSLSETLLNAKKEGSANLMVWDLDNNVSLFDIHVSKDTATLLQVLKRIDSKGEFEIYPSKDVFVIKGNTSSVDKAKQIEKAANAFAEGSVSLVRVVHPKQVLLHTRFIQIDRTLNHDFGLDFQDMTRTFAVIDRYGQTGVHLPATGAGGDTFTPRNSVITYNLFDQIPNSGSPQVSGFYFTRGVGFLPYLKALEEKGIVKTIARPDLLAKDGEEASFLVGGEAAIVVSTQDSINVNYKEFGTRLKFTPEILNGNKIRLTVEPEVSSLNAANGVTVGNTQIPGFSTTKAKTVVELEVRETFMLGGLLQQQINKTDSGAPFLRRIPIIGRLFQSLTYTWRDTELLVLVTPELILPEKAPVLEEAPEHDILSKAAQLTPYPPMPDQNSDAIVRYMKGNKRYAADPMARSEAAPVLAHRISLDAKAAAREAEFAKDSASPEKMPAPEPKVPSKNLDELEARLRWT